tara:strand:+ start:258 stop:2558 length:2301 start_codon:yes stop_codon:yes gene_type:complete
MALQNIQLRPGIVRETTSYANEGGWFDGDMVRFRYGVPEKFGGWEKYTTSSFSGTCRSLHTWTALSGGDFLGLGTNLKFYIESGITFYDITPIRRTASLTAAALVTTNTETLITVTDGAHGAEAEDFVTFTGLSDVNGVPAGDLNIEHQITQVLDSNIYTITVTGAATSTGAGSSGDAFTAEYQINVGATAAVGGTGWGAGLWGGQVLGGSATTLNGAISSPSSTSNITLTSATGFSTASSTLSSDVIDIDSSITVADASSFPSAGTIIINSEVIRYLTLTGNVFSDLTRGAFGTTDAAHSSSDTVTYLGVVLIDNELITYTGVSTNDLTGITRATRGTTGATHSDGATVQDASSFIGWGDASSISVVNELRLWSQDNFGQDLLFNVRDGVIYYWQKSLGVASRGVELSSLTGATDVPTVCRQIMVSDISRHVIAFGCNAIGETDQDRLLIRFSNQQSAVDWSQTTDNTAGSLVLGSGSEFVSALETKREIVIWTESSLHSMTYIGGELTYGLNQLATSLTIAGPNAVVAADDVVYWMGKNTFYRYDGRVQQVQCAVKSKVFDDFNVEQAKRVCGGLNSEFSEIIWFYPVADEEENSNYVIFNYAENVWYYGTLSRTAWIDRGSYQYPMATDASATSYLYNHEKGNDNDGSAISSYIESSQFDLGQGESFSFVDRIIPDLTFNGSSVTSPAATFTIKARNYPGAGYDQSDVETATRTATTPVEEFTNELYVRIRGRSVALRVGSTEVGVQWRLGVPRLNIRPDGRR